MDKNWNDYENIKKIVAGLGWLDYECFSPFKEKILIILLL